MYVITFAIYEYIIFLIAPQGKWLYSEVTCLSEIRRFLQGQELHASPWSSVF